MHLNRRSAIVAGSLAVPLISCTTGAAPAAEVGVKLKDLARLSGRFFGSAVRSGALVSDPRYWPLVARQCEVLTPEGELKWASMSSRRGTYQNRRADFLLDAAGRAGIKVRGHALVWHQAIPQWVMPELTASAKSLQSLLDDQVAQMVARYRGKVIHWDVVNEALDPQSDDGYRGSPYFSRLGFSYLSQAFRVAREHDSEALLFYNDYGFEQDGRRSEKKRSDLLKMLDKMISQGVPIDGVGLQAHLYTGARFEIDQYSAFLRDLSDRNLRVVVSELDVSDKKSIGLREVRDRDIAALTGDFLSCCLENSSVEGVVTWGITSMHSSLNDWGDAFRGDGLSSRGLPFDSDYKPSALFEAMAHAFRVAAVGVHFKGAGRGA